MLKTIRLFAIVGFLTGGLNLLSAAEPSPGLKKSKATTEENRVSSRLAGETDQVKEIEESVPSPISAQGSAEVLHGILATWRERAKKTTGMRVSWKEQVRISPGGIVPAEVATERGFPEKFSKTGVPASEISFNYQAQLLLGGSRVRYETQTIGLDDNFDAYTQPYVSSFDGNSSRMLFSGEKGKPFGSIREEQHNVDARNYVLRPLFLFLRPLNPIYATFDEESLEFASPADTSEAEKAIVLKKHEESVTDLVWLDDDLQYVVTRWEQHVNMRHHPTSPGIVLAIAADIEYASDSNLGHVPVSWTVLEFDTSRNAPSKRYEATDVKFEVLQQPVPQSEFALEFPKGTEVYDHPTKRTIIAGSNESWLTDGQKKYILANLIFILVLVIAILVYRRKRQLRK